LHSKIGQTHGNGPLYAVKNAKSLLNPLLGVKQALRREQNFS
jgi:hypothetical protein